MYVCVYVYIDVQWNPLNNGHIGTSQFCPLQRALLLQGSLHLGHQSSSIIRRLFLLRPLFRGYFYCVHYSEVISIVSIIQRLFLLRPLFRDYFYCVHYSEVISIASIIQRLFQYSRCPFILYVCNRTRQKKTYNSSSSHQDYPDLPQSCKPKPLVKNVKFPTTNPISK